MEHEYQELEIEDLVELTDEEIEEYFNSLPATGAGIEGVFEFNNVPFDNYEVTEEPIIIGDFQVENIDTGWEASAFGIELNDRDDFFTVGVVLVIAMILYAGKVAIDHFFNCLLERYKKKLEKE